MYTHIFNTQFNISFFTPKIDQCEECESNKNNENEQHLCDFQLFKLDRNKNTNIYSRGGGVLIAVKSNIKATLIQRTSIAFNKSLFF